jgi:ABC-type uncharacterized transport system substrate-binding protein
LEAKRLGLLTELVPGMKRMAFLGDFRNSAVTTQWQAEKAAAKSLAIEVKDLAVRSAADISVAFETAIREQVDAVRVGVYGSREDGVMGSLAARRVAQSDRASVW